LTRVPDALPSVDLGHARASSHLLSGLESCSAVLLRGHGIDPDLRREVIARSREFFALPRERKAEVQWPGDGAWYGWQPVFEGASYLTGTRLPDLVERFEVHDLDRYELWPAVSGFRDAWTAYYRACGSLASTLIRMLAFELNLPAAELEDWTDRQFANLVANHYPPQPEPPAPGQTRVGAHTDRGGVTLLTADEAPGGLEVWGPRRGWTPVVIPEDAYVVQVGDLFASWTNRRVRANVHRVVNPPRPSAPRASRLAVVFFHYPHLDTLVTPAPSCVDPVGPQLPPVRCRDHLLRRQEQFKVRSNEVVTAP
jgi:isopenicillin N synthase-like dioxygenase